VEANQSSPARAAGRLNVSACLIYISLMDIHIYIYRAAGVGERGWGSGSSNWNGLRIYRSRNAAERIASILSTCPYPYPTPPPSLSLSLFDTRQDDKYKMRYIDE